MYQSIQAAPLAYLQHHLFLLTLDDNLGLAPPNDHDSKVKRVLDVGTGTGIWAVDYADEHPEAQVRSILNSGLIATKVNLSGDRR